LQLSVCFQFPLPALELEQAKSCRPTKASKCK
jgi:hypothetical protein